MTWLLLTILSLKLVNLAFSLRELRKARAEAKQARLDLEEDKRRLAEARAESDRIMEELKLEIGEYEMSRCGRN